MKGILKIKNKTKWLVYTALMTALTAVAAIVVQVPSIEGGYTNICDSIIFMTAVLMDPVAAMIAGGLGTFLADLLVYPATMWWSLAFHGIEGLAVGLLIWILPHKEGKVQHVFDSIYMLIGGLLMMTGYYFAKAYAYGTPASALISLWRNAIQVIMSIVVANLLLYPLKLKRLVDRHELYGNKIKETSGNSNDAPPISPTE